MAPFRVIIVGGGPVGLIQAHTLCRANIDYVLLERREEIISPLGAAILLWPQTLRLFDQLGLLNRAERISHVIDKIADTDASGSVFRNSTLLGKVGESQGYALRIFQRSKLVEMLYRELPDRENRVKTSKSVSRIEIQEQGVRAELDDGSTEIGSIVIGADGVWSTVRQQISKLAGEEEHAPAAMPFTVKYIGAFGRCRSFEDQPNGYCISRHSLEDGMGFQLYTTPEQNFFIAYRHRDKLGYNPHLGSDGESFVKEFLDEKICGDISIRDVWDDRVSSDVTELHEGMLKRWYWNRIVLIGDAVHKITPNEGSGANNGIESAVSLANELQRLLRMKGDPKTDEIEKAFAAYQADRQTRVEMWAQNANTEMGRLLWSNSLKSFMVTHMMPLADRLGYIEGQVNGLVSKSSRLNPEAFDTANVPWKPSRAEKW
ncbi:hypothetical protein BX600DRAFT_495460 [Xylariales sp. PMI_506]|nr:hypothetical protein BX600DRAFT_495460 [Xylariales sp. PMI_506]